ncbi:DUF3037 domain-containing protein [uncultured Jatrophihabitans sp.]|uniref:DUF3037 domain-containing protein n=1 Tax=uncultured Jatrophihabitans sp. TaxID=1610747 RepID=UPI0035CBB96A
MTRLPFEYAVLRVVPRMERGELVNAGVVLYCPGADFLGAAVALDEQRVRALDPDVDVAMVTAALAAVVGTCDGSGRAAAEDRGRRFRWLTAPRSTMIQPGPVHTGFTTDPVAELDRLCRVLVAPVPSGEV